MSVEVVPASARAEVKYVDPRDPVAQRILTVLEACAASRRPITVTELVKKTSLAKSTVHRMCWNLEKLGFLEHTDGGFSVGTKLFALANANPVVAEMRAVAIPYLLDLQRTTNCASALAILFGGRALVVDGLYTQGYSTKPRVGVALPLHCTALGKALLAQLAPADRDQLLGRRLLPKATSRSISHPMMIQRQMDTIVQSGFAFSNEEYEAGKMAVAAAFRTSEGTVAALACVGSSTNRMVGASAANHVRNAAAQVQRAMVERGY